MREPSWMLAQRRYDGEIPSARELGIAVGGSRNLWQSFFGLGAVPGPCRERLREQRPCSPLLQAPIDECVNTLASGASNSGTLFRFDTNQYIYNLSTNGYASGTYLLRTTINDGTTHDLQFSIR